MGGEACPRLHLSCLGEGQIRGRETATLQPSLTLFRGCFVAVLFTANIGKKVECKQWLY